MTPEDRERMNLLCLRIQNEKNADAFDALVKELVEFLEVHYGNEPKKSNS